MGFFTRKLMTIAPLAIGGLIAILYFKKAFGSSAGEAGADIGGSASSIGQGIGSGLSGVGSGVSTLGQGLGTGIAGLLNPIYTLIDIGGKLGWGESDSSTQSKAEIRTSGQPRTSSGGGSSKATSTTTNTSGYTSKQQGSYVNKSGGVSSY